MNIAGNFPLTDPLAALLGEWAVTLNPYSVLLRVFMVVLLASIIGCERSSKRHCGVLSSKRKIAALSIASCLQRSSAPSRQPERDLKIFRGIWRVRFSFCTGMQEKWKTPCVSESCAPVDLSGRFEKLPRKEGQQP